MEKCLPSTYLASLLRLVCVCLALFAFSLNARAEISYLTEAEFRALANELAPKVNLFHDAWSKDPQAVFYGGTTRDYLYWIKGKFLEAHSREQALEIEKELRELPIIDVREFIIGESDVDVISKNGLEINPSQYGVRKIDSIAPDIFDTTTELGKNELWQGHVPVEKIQLSAKGVTQNPTLGNGMHEIYTGKLSVHFPDPIKFAETKYAKEGVNHPVLLALRYLRLQGINYFKTHGAGYPEEHLLMSGFDENSARETAKVIDRALDGKELLPFLGNSRFKSWMNGTIQKSFRSYTNPTAALQILKKFSVDRFSRIYGENEVEPINQYVFTQHRDPEKIKANLDRYHVDNAAFYESPKARFPDGFLYHGTRTEEAFRSILFQGVLPSEQGAMDGGLYGVAESNKSFSENWGGDKQRLLRFPVKADAKIVDIDQGEGARVYREFQGSSDEFAEAFGVDILRYPYSTEAFVVKNSGALGPASGVYRELLPFSALLKRAKTITDADTLINTLELNQVSTKEAKLIVNASKVPEAQLLAAIQKEIKSTNQKEMIDLFRESRIWQTNSKLLAEQLLDSVATGDWHDWYRQKIISHVMRSVSEGHILLDADFLAKIANLNAGSGPAGEAIYGEITGNKNWPKLTETINAIYEKDSREALVLQMIARTRLSPAEQAKITPSLWEKAAAQLETYDMNDTQVQLSKFFLNPPKPEFLPEILGVLEKTSEFLGNPPLQNVIFTHWADHPEILEPYLNSTYLSEDQKKLLTLKFLDYPEWLKYDALLGKFLEKSGMVPPMPLLETAGWSKNINSLKKVIEAAVEKGGGNGIDENRVRNLLFPYLLKNDLWEKDPALLESLIGKVHSTEFISLIRNPKLVNHPEIMEALVQNSAWLPDGAAEIAGVISRKTEWLAQPRVVKSIIKASNSGTNGLAFVQMAQQILGQPEWAVHPELVEDFVAAPNISKTSKKWLLDHVHWQNHPAFAHLKEDGRISLKKMRQEAQAKDPNYRPLSMKIKEGCASFFSALTKF